jgi:D-alanine-D-alanine ligase
MKQKVLVLFGGQSTEHEVSCVSAATIIRCIDRDKYDVILVGITHEGHWLLTDDVARIEDGTWRDGRRTAVLSPDATTHGIIVLDGDAATVVRIDLCFPVLHGMYGEDGTVQGLLELAGIPYVGCGVLASAVSMDKLYTKIIADSCGVSQARYVAVHNIDCEDHEDVIRRVEAALDYPVFVKPANAGSSCGVSCAGNRQELAEAIAFAAKVDNEILFEETIHGRELECAVFSDGRPEASGVGEILSAGSFYDYDSKYNNAESRTIVNPELPEGKEEEIREAAVRVFTAVGGKGFSRVDFFLEDGTNRVIFNEINTIPGFTAISMYPMLWEARSVSKEALVDKLLGSASLRRRASSDDNTRAGGC